MSRCLRDSTFSHFRRRLTCGRQTDRQTKRQTDGRTGSQHQGCSLGLDVSVSRRSRDVVSKRLGLVSVSWKRGKVSVSISTRTENQMSRSRLALVPEGLVYKPICTAFCFIAKMHVHRFECRASIYCLLIHKLRFRLHPCCIHLQLQCSTQLKKSFSLTLLMQNL